VVGQPRGHNAPKMLERQIMLATPTGKRPRDHPRTRRPDYISDLTWCRLGLEPAELSEVAGNREVVISCLLTYPPKRRSYGWVKNLRSENIITCLCNGIQIHSYQMQADDVYYEQLYHLCLSCKPHTKLAWKSSSRPKQVWKSLTVSEWAWNKIFLAITGVR